MWFIEENHNTKNTYFSISPARICIYEDLSLFPVSNCLSIKRIVWFFSYNLEKQEVYYFGHICTVRFTSILQVEPYRRTACPLHKEMKSKDVKPGKYGECASHQSPEFVFCHRHADYICCFLWVFSRQNAFMKIPRVNFSLKARRGHKLQFSSLIHHSFEGFWHPAQRQRFSRDIFH